MGKHFAEIADYYRGVFRRRVLLPGDFYVIYGGNNGLECDKSMYIITGGSKNYYRGPYLFFEHFNTHTGHDIGYSRQLEHLDVPPE